MQKKQEKTMNIDFSGFFVRHKQLWDIMGGTVSLT